MEDLFFTMKFAWQKLSELWAAVTPIPDWLRVAAHIFKYFGKLRSFRKCDNGIDNNSEDEASYRTQYQEAVLIKVEIEYCAKHWRLAIINHKSIWSNTAFPSPMASGSGQSEFDSYDSFSNDEKYITSKDVAETTPRRSDCAARSLIAAWLYLNSPCAWPKNLGQVIWMLIITTSTQWILAVHSVHPI